MTQLMAQSFPTFLTDIQCVLPRHTEDADLHSVNYLHYGAPKVWYCVAPEHKAKMDQFLAKSLSAQHHQCNNFLRHKVSPCLLLHWNMDGQFFIQLSLGSLSVCLGFTGWNADKSVPSKALLLLLNLSIGL